MQRWKDCVTQKSLNCLETILFVYLTGFNFQNVLYYSIFHFQIINPANYHRQTRIHHHKKNYVTKYSVNFWRQNPFIASTVKTNHKMLYKMRGILSNIKNGINSRISLKSNQVRTSLIFRSIFKLWHLLRINF